MSIMDTSYAEAREVECRVALFKLADGTFRFMSGNLGNGTYVDDDVITLYAIHPPRPIGPILHKGYATREDAISALEQLTAQE